MSSGRSNGSRCRASASRKGQPFQPDDKIRALLSEAARLGGAIARANTFGAPETYYYSDRKWQGVPEGMTYKSTRDDAPQIDANNVYYMAAGNSPAMMAKERWPGIAISLDVS